eukprot:713948-Rhodomonas_salina.3
MQATCRSLIAYGATRCPTRRCTADTGFDHHCDMGLTAADMASTLAGEQDRLWPTLVLSAQSSDALPTKIQYHCHSTSPISYALSPECP